MHIVFGLLLLNILVFFHELGHFFASRICGVKVEAFSLGMGPVLLHKKIFGTDWRISLLPLGGYCAMKGEKLFDDDDSEFIAHEPDSFLGTKAIFRAIIAVAGPAANFLFAVFAFIVISLVGYSYYSSEPFVQIATEFYPEMHSAAADGGIRTGDKILKINDEETLEFADIPRIVSAHPDEDLIFQIERKNPENADEKQVLNFTVHTDFAETQDDDGSITRTGKIGVMSMQVDVKGLGFFQSVAEGTKRTISLIALYLKEFSRLFQKNGPSISESVGGPARITTMIGDSTRQGFYPTMQLMALISISLFIMNLLPIPVLDGWMIFISIIETIIGRQIPKTAKIVAQIIGICLIILIFLVAITSDIKYFVGLFHAKN